MSISAISGISPADAIRPISGSTGSSGAAFQDVLANAISTVQSANTDATHSIERFLSGEGEDLHDTVLATDRAEISFELFQQVRNKVVTAYQEIMKMQL